MTDEIMDKTIKMGKLIERIPCFDGTKQKLNGFIKQVDTVAKYAKPVTSIHKDLFVQNIRSRITGKAEEHLDVTNTEDCWDEIKRSLINRFADQRNEAYLLQQLYATYQGKDTIGRYYEKIQEILNSLQSWANLNCTSEAEKKFSIQFYTKTGLTVFTAHINEPTGTMLRGRQPLTIQDAYNFCIEEENLRKLNFQNNPNFTPLRPPPKFTAYNSPIPQFRPQLPPKLPPQNVQKLAQNEYYNHRPFISHKKVPSINHEPMDTTSNTNRFKQPVYQVKRPSSLNEPGKIVQKQRLYNVENYDIEENDEYEEDNENPILDIETDENQDFRNDQLQIQDT